MAPEKRASRAESPKPEKKDEKDGAADKKGNEKSEKASGGLFTPKNAAILAVVGVVVFGVYTAFGDKVDVKGALEKAVVFVEGQGQTAVMWYCLFTFIGVVCLIPTTPMELAGGFLFSPIYGMWMVLVFTGTAKLLANIVSVLIARFIVKDWVMKNVVAKNELLTMVSKAVKEEPWKMAFLVRGAMIPLFVKNYGLGVMDIGYLPIAACSMIFTNFYAFQNIYMGSACQDLKEVFAPKKVAEGPMDWTSTAKKLMPVVFNVLLVVFLVKAVKAQVKKQKALIEDDLKKKTEKKAE
jgi:uncharacterized membrane protein YdjX (TVP38/TMEM64 family)